MDPLDIFAECKECYAQVSHVRKFCAVIFLCHHVIAIRVLYLAVFKKISQTGESNSLSTVHTYVFKMLCY